MPTADGPASHHAIAIRELLSWFVRAAVRLACTAIMAFDGKRERSSWLDRMERAAAAHSITLSQPQEDRRPLSDAPEYASSGYGEYAFKQAAASHQEDPAQDQTNCLTLMLKKLESRIEQMEREHKRELVRAHNRVDTMAALAKHPNSGRADRSAAALQAAARRQACARAYTHALAAARTLQRASLRRLTWKAMAARRSAATMIQAACRRHLCRVLYSGMRAKIACYVVAQRLARGRAARLMLARTVRATTRIQACWRRLAPRRAFVSRVRAARIIQRCERAFAGRFLRDARRTKSQVLRERLALERRLAKAEARVHHLEHGKQATIDGMRGQLAEIISATITCDLCFKIPDFMQVSCASCVGAMVGAPGAGPPYPRLFCLFPAPLLASPLLSARTCTAPYRCASSIRLMHPPHPYSSSPLGLAR